MRGFKSRGVGRIVSSRRAHRAFAIGITTLLVALASPLLTSQVSAANPSANLDQCENGKTSAPKTPCKWVNGNLGPNNSHYQEGDSVPFRIRFDNLATTGSHTVVLEWDTTKQGKHAYDYLTTWNQTETTADPCTDVADCTVTPPPLPIPDDPNASVTQLPGVFTMFDGTVTSASAYTLTGSYSGNSSTRITVTFTATEADPVLAWAGHIAREADWGGPGTSASGIAGSPYHMRLISLDGSGGNQDRSLKVGAADVGSITVVKQATPEGPRPFDFSASDGLGTFTLVDDGADTTAPFNSKTFGGLTNFANNHTYDFTETVPAGWQLSSITCTSDGTKPADFTTTGSTVKVKLEKETNVTCVFNNANVVPTITVTKTPSPTSVPESGAPVTFSVSVTNNSTVEQVTLTGLNDSDFGNVTAISGTSCATGGTIAAGGTYNCSFTKTISGDFGGPDHVNVLTATADDPDGGTATDDDDATVTFTDVQPTINVDKSASASVVRTGRQVTYTYVVTTAGPESLEKVTVTDDKCSPVTFVSGDDGDGGLEPGESWSYTCTTALTSSTVNTATATGSDDDGNTVTDTDTASVSVVDPRIAVDKSADPKSTNPGGRVTYTYLVSNPGVGELSDVVLTDDKCSPVTFGGGDTDGDSRLDTGETWRYTCSIVAGTGAGALTNVATVTAKDPTGGTVSANDTETITVVEAVFLEQPRGAAAVTMAAPQVGSTSLPATGADSKLLLTVGVSLILVGLLLLLPTRCGRRRTAWIL